MHFLVHVFIAIFQIKKKKAQNAADTPNKQVNPLSTDDHSDVGVQANEANQLTAFTVEAGDEVLLIHWRFIMATILVLIVTCRRKRFICLG